MTRDEVLAMAEQAGIKYRHTPVGTNEMWCYDDAILRFAALVAAAEREECARVCEQIAGPDGLNVPEKKYFYYTDDGNGCASAIRARSAK